MMTLEGTTITPPNSYQVDLIPTAKKHMIFNKGYVRNSINSKYVIKIEWHELTEDEKDVIWALYKSQYTDSKALSYTHTGVLPGGKDIGPIDIRLIIEHKKRLQGQNKFSIRAQINEY